VTRPDSHTRYEELAAGYALHALEPEDEQLFVEHLAACARCERDVIEHEATLAQLAYAPAAPAPPPSVLEGIRAGVRASGREPSCPDPTAFPNPTPETVPAQDGPVVPFDRARRRRDAARLRRAGAWSGIAAAAALVLSLGIWNAALQQDRAEQAEWGARMAKAVAQLRDEATETVPLRAADTGDVVAVALVRGDELSLVVDGLPVNDAATTYVLWGESRYGDKRAVGAFDVTDEGLDVLDGMRLQASVADVTRYMVTREQGDEAPPIPTLPVLAVGTV
jgi:anti-sigma-K factor RskA